MGPWHSIEAFMRKILKVTCGRAKPCSRSYQDHMGRDVPQRLIFRYFVLDLIWYRLFAEFNALNRISLGAEQECAFHMLNLVWSVARWQSEHFLLAFPDPSILDPPKSQRTRVPFAKISGLLKRKVATVGFDILSSTYIMDL